MAIAKTYSYALQIGGGSQGNNWRCVLEPARILRKCSFFCTGSVVTRTILLKIKTNGSEAEELYAGKKPLQKCWMNHAHKRVVEATLANVEGNTVSLGKIAVLVHPLWASGASCGTSSSHSRETVHREGRRQPRGRRLWCRPHRLGGTPLSELPLPWDSCASSCSC